MAIFILTLYLYSAVIQHFLTPKAEKGGFQLADPLAFLKNPESTDLDMAAFLL